MYVYSLYIHYIVNQDYIYNVGDRYKLCADGCECKNGKCVGGDTCEYYFETKAWYYKEMKCAYNYGTDNTCFPKLCTCAGKWSRATCINNGDNKCPNHPDELKIWLQDPKQKTSLQWIIHNRGNPAQQSHYKTIPREKWYEKKKIVTETTPKSRVIARKPIVIEPIKPKPLKDPNEQTVFLGEECM